MDLSFLQPIILIKIITLIAIAFYVIFTLVIFTQIKAMGEIIGLPFASGIFKTIIIMNIILSILFFVLGSVIL